MNDYQKFLESKRFDDVAALIPYDNSVMALLIQQSTLVDGQFPDGMTDSLGRLVAVGLAFRHNDVGGTWWECAQ